MQSLGWQGFPGGSVVKNPPANAGDVVSILGSERSHGEGNGKENQFYSLDIFPLQGHTSMWVSAWK